MEKFNRRIFLLNASSMVAFSGLSVWAQQSCGPPPPSAPQRRKGGESFPPLPLPVTPMRRTEKKKPPAPPTLMAKINYGVTKTGTRDGSPYQYFDWTTDPGDTGNLFKYVRSRMGVNYKAETVRFSEYHLDPQQMPIVYFTGHEAFKLGPEHREVLRAYAMRGGFIFGDACCGSPEFALSFAAEMRTLFPDRPWHALPPEHAMFTSFDKITNVNYQEGEKNYFSKRPMLEGLNLGCRTAIILSRADVSCGWDGHTHPEGLRVLPKDAKRLGLNLVAYQLSYYRLGRFQSVDTVYRDDLRSPREIEVAQIRHNGDWDPSPTAISNLLKEVSVNTTGNVKYRRTVIDPESADLHKFPFLLMTGHLNFTFSEKARKNLKEYLESGGFVFATNCCNRLAFDQAVRREFAGLYKGKTFQTLPKDHPIFKSHFDLSKVPSTQTAGTFGALTVPAIEGLESNGTFPIVYCAQSPFSSWDGEERPFIDLLDPRVALRTGVNTVVYAMTH